MIVLVPFTMLYVAASALLVAYLSRRIPFWIRLLRRCGRRQVRAVSASRISTTIVGQAAALVFVIIALGSKQELISLALNLYVYTFVSLALMLSLFAQMPLFKQLWEDAFTKLVILGAPVLCLFLAQGFAANWTSDLLGVTARDAPVAYVTATALLLTLGAGFFFFLTGLIFEVAGFGVWVLPQASAKNTKQQKPSRPWRYVSTLLALKRRPGTEEHRNVRRFYRDGKLAALMGVSFFASIMGLNIAAALVSSSLGGALISASAFMFDAIPATTCDLDEQERLLASGDIPTIKALVLPGGRAVLLRRHEHLLTPRTIKELRSDKSRSLSVVRVTQCFRGAAGVPEREVPIDSLKR